MSDEIEVEGHKLISSKRASELSGYAQDYIGQLARKSLVEARRIGGLWYVSMDSLSSYKDTALNPKPRLLVSTDTPDTEPQSFVFLDGKEYISAALAAEITGYHQDYIGQLARSGKIICHQVGNRWYVDKKDLLDHKEEKDLLLANVQTDAVGLKKQVYDDENSIKGISDERDLNTGVLKYTEDTRDVIPLITEKDDIIDTLAASAIDTSEYAAEPVNLLAIRKKIESPRTHLNNPSKSKRVIERKRRNISNAWYLGARLPAALGVTAVILVGGFGLYRSLQSTSAMVQSIRLTASGSEAFSGIETAMQELFSRTLTYKRTN